jgi:hypothetical protein
MTPLLITILLFWLALFHVLPAVLVIAADRVRGSEMQLWVAAVFFTSWLGFVAFMIVTTLDRKPERANDAALGQRRRNLPALDISDHGSR